MGKKRKANAAGKDVRLQPEFDPHESRKRIKTFADVADSDEEFHLNQDEIRLGEKPESKRRRKWAEQEEFLQPSDEDVLSQSEDEDPHEADYSQEDGEPAEDNDEGGNGIDESEEEGLRWGVSKDDLYGADQIETEEQALEEEAEARRLQKKQLQAMQTADYGFDDKDWQQGAEGPLTQADGKGDVITEHFPEWRTVPNLSVDEKIRLLSSRNPEFEPLSNEFLRLRERLSKLTTESTISPAARAKQRALRVYVGVLIMYFSLLTSTPCSASRKTPAIAMPAVQLRAHPVMDALVQCRELWNKVEQLPDKDEDINKQDERPEVTDDSARTPEQSTAPAYYELDQLQPEKRQTRAERYAEAVQAAADKRTAERLRRAEADFADLDDLLVPDRHKAIGLRQPATMRKNTEEFGPEEEAPLTFAEAAQKANRKKSLRFYTSQIAQKANRRGVAGRTAGGDDDIPYRERLRDRQTRLNAEAEKRGRKGAEMGGDLDQESNEEDDRQAKQIRADAEEDDYYDLVAARTAKKKGDKAALAETHRQAALQGGRVVEQESLGPDGKRKISYAIEKNKGLTPHRKKDVRNPRVKKRKKFDEKMKKLGSIKPVYKGGEGRGGYGGELTGIKKGLVKSTKL